MTKLLERIAARLGVYRCSSKNPLLSDPEYAGLSALEADMRRRHLPVRSVSKAKQDRLHQLLARRAA